MSKVIRNLYVVLSCFFFVITLSVYLKGDSNDKLSELVTVMYEFDTPAELLANQQVLEILVPDNLYNRINLDADGRVISHYYRFKYSPSHVNLLRKGANSVIYSVENDYIDSNREWVVIATISDDGIISELFEYEILDSYEGGATS